MSVPTLECRVVGPEMAKALADFFARLTAAGVSTHFHPHPFTAEEAERRANFSGQDLYYVLWDGGVVLGYGMLRGWDQGYEVPSIGIAVDPRLKGQGMGRMFMEFLHAAARLR